MSITTSRRAILAGAVSLAATPAFASATAPDPIYAAIEVHRVARAAFWANVPGETDEESDERLSRTGGPADEALVGFLETVPTTSAGCIAALRHLHHHLGEYEEAEQNIMGHCTEDMQEVGAGFLALIADTLTKTAVQS